MREAGSPGGVWSPERKLFTGSRYDPVNDPTIGPPEYPLHAMFPGPGQLGASAFLSEPALLARPEGIYVAMTSEGPLGGKVLLLRCAHDFGSVEYLGDLVVDSDAAALGTAYDGFSAPELVETAQGIYLVVTPTEPPFDLYRGCVVLRITSLATATVARSGGKVVVVKSVSGDAGSFNGACAYSPSLSTSSGIIYGQFFYRSPPEFRLFASGVTLD
ncbi:MAG: hypothetical protein ACE5EO_11435 [Candidatus Krumholzibacteriia bacterium]